MRASRFPRRQACGSPLSADLAGRRVGLSGNIPAEFDAPLAAHHKVIGRWAASRAAEGRRFTRPEAQRWIEQQFAEAVHAILGPFKLADFRVAVICGDDDLPPALAVICTSVGQIDMGWIEKSNLLRDTLAGYVAPVGWRATAYRALVETLHVALPIFCYDHLVDEIAAYYWDGETDDEGARKALAFHHGTEDLEDMEVILPSDVAAQRPDFMLPENVEPVKHFPAELRRKLRRLRDAHKAVKDRLDGSAWHFDFGEICEYIPELQDCAHLPPLTLVPFDHFARELDEVARWGMEMGFMDVAGLCRLPDAAKVEEWFTTLRLGAEVLLAAQDLIDLDPSKLR